MTTKLDWHKRLRGADLTPTEGWVAFLLDTWSDADGTNARPGLENLVDATGLSEDTVRRTLRALEVKGVVRMTHQGGGQGNANVYAVDHDWGRRRAEKPKKKQRNPRTRARVQEQSNPRTSAGQTPAPVRANPRMGATPPGPYQVQEHQVQEQTTPLTPQPEAAGTTEGGGGISDPGSPSRQAAGLLVVEGGRDTDAGVALSTGEPSSSSGHGQQEQPSEGAAMEQEQPVWVKVGLPTFAEMDAFFWARYDWVKQPTKMLEKWLDEPGGEERLRYEVAEWQQATRPERDYQAARVEHAEHVADADALRFFGLRGSVRAVDPLHGTLYTNENRLRPPSNEGGLRSSHRLLLAYVAACGRDLSAADLTARAEALPVHEHLSDCPDLIEWLDEQQAEPAYQVEVYDPLTDFAYAGGDPMAQAF